MSVGDPVGELLAEFYGVWADEANCEDFVGYATSWFEANGDRLVRALNLEPRYERVDWGGRDAVGAAISFLNLLDHLAPQLAPLVKGDDEIAVAARKLFGEGTWNGEIQRDLEQIANIAVYRKVETGE